MFFGLLDEIRFRAIMKLHQKVSFGTEAAKFDETSEIGHVHHVPKPPSEGETHQKNSTPFFNVHV